MCLFIISSAVSELKRHLVVRTVINSLIPLPLSLALLSYPPLFIPSSSSQRTLFLLHKHADRSSVALLSRFTPPPHSSFSFYICHQPIPCTTFIFFVSVSLLPIDTLKDRCSLMYKAEKGKEELPSDWRRYLEKESGVESLISNDPWNHEIALHPLFHPDVRLFLCHIFTSPNT